MSLVGVVLLVAAVALLGFAEWPRLARSRPGGVAKPRRRKAPHLRVVEPDDDSDEFARAVERDLARLPTIEDRD
jgi:hypothetical protein